MVQRDGNVCTLYAYDLAGNTVVVTDTLGRMTRTFYDTLGRVDARVTNWNPATLTSPADCVLSPTNESDENVCTLYGYNGVGRMVEATVFTLTTVFTYNGLGARVAIEVVGQGVTTYVVDYAGGNRILAEQTVTGTGERLGLARNAK